MARDREQSTGPDYPGGPTGDGGAASIVPVEHIQSRILLIRGQKVILDADLAELYGVRTSAPVQATKRNGSRFPPDFMFRLTQDEFQVLRSQFVTSNGTDKRGGRRYRPYAFTEHGAIVDAIELLMPPPPEEEASREPFGSGRAQKN